MDVKKLVIVGGVAGGASAAAKARRCSEEVEIIMYEKGHDISYANCGLPYYLSGVINKRKDLLITTPEFFQLRFHVDARPRHEVIDIDRQKKQVVARNLDNGKTEVETYDRLILAVGSNPVIPRLQGIDRPFVFTLKTLEDTDRIYQFLNSKMPGAALVVGAGLIGVEVMENLVLRGIKTTVIEYAPQMLAFLDWEMAEIVRLHVEGKGVNVHLSEALESIEEHQGKALAVTNKGRKISADLVLIAVGIRPNVDLAKKAGLAIGVSGGIKVNELMQTSDPHVFAAGDCIEAINIVTGKPVLIPMGSAANKQGRAAGANAMGRKIAIRGFSGTIIVKVFDLTVAKTGISEGECVKEGISPLVTYVHPGHHAGYFPGARPLHIKTVADRDTGRLVGAQVIGEEGVDKRIDVFATAIYNKMNVEELVHLDLSYAPPYSAARDPVIIAGMVGQNFYQGDWDPITPAMLHEKIQQGDPPLIVDVRNRQELLKTGTLPGAINIPIDELRGRLHEINPEREVVLYCAQGLRSYLGHRILSMNGFERVRTLTGGTLNWMYGLTPMS